MDVTSRADVVVPLDPFSCDVSRVHVFEATELSFCDHENMLTVQIFKVLLSVHMCCFDKRFALFVLSGAFQVLLLILNLKFK